MYLHPAPGNPRLHDHYIMLAVLPESHCTGGIVEPRPSHSQPPFWIYPHWKGMANLRQDLVSPAFQSPSCRSNDWMLLHPAFDHPLSLFRQVHRVRVLAYIIMIEW